MDDQFLYRPQQSVDPEFKESLLLRLKAIDSQKKPKYHVRKSIAAIIVAVVLLSFSSPTIRAQIDNWVRQIITFGEVDLITLPPSSRVVGGGYHSNNTVEQIQETEAQAILPYEIPSWTPPEFTKEDTVSFFDYGGSELAITQRWSSGVEDFLYLYVLNNPQPQLVVGAYSDAENININGHDGVIYSGSWDRDTGQYQGDQLNIVWVKDNIAYFLAGENINREVLLRIARSFN